MSADYLAAEFAPGDLPAGLAALIHRHSDGNPLFMTAMLDHLVASRASLSQAARTVDHDHAAGAGRSGRAGDAQADARDAAAATRTKRSSTCSSARASPASVSRPGPWRRCWRTRRRRIEEICEGLVQRQQFLKVAGVRELRVRNDRPSSIEFRHALYRDVLYRRLNPTQRVTFHRRLAEGSKP